MKWVRSDDFSRFEAMRRLKSLLQTGLDTLLLNARLIFLAVDALKDKPDNQANQECSWFRPVFWGKGRLLRGVLGAGKRSSSLLFLARC